MPSKPKKPAEPPAFREQSSLARNQCKFAESWDRPVLLSTIRRPDLRDVDVLECWSIVRRENAVAA